jgi:pyrroloquinoline quinone (PQQ) biosynthesis protein C
MTLQAAAADVKARANWRENPYFAALRDRTFARDDFVETQVQFLYAVSFFSRPMAVLAARLPLPTLRRNLLLNVAEEHGEGDLDHAHPSTFLRLLAELGVPFGEVERRALWPELRAFNTTLTGLCLMDDPPTAVAAMGMIEDLFAEISAFLGQTLVHEGWVSAERVVHYTTHEELDVQHAREFYDVIRPLWGRHPRHDYQITQGLELGAYVFLRMYRDLYEARARRWTRPFTGPHTVADGWGLADP